MNIVKKEEISDRVVYIVGWLSPWGNGNWLIWNATLDSISILALLSYKLKKLEEMELFDTTTIGRLGNYSFM